MTVDVRAFAPTNAIDTCAIWNLLSSARLVSAALGRQRWFVVADYVRYEALERPRTGLPLLGDPGEILVERVG